MILYDDEGNLVTNPDTLEALEESEQIIADWKKRHGIINTGEQNQHSENF